MADSSRRTALVRKGILLEVFTLLWMLAEAAVSIGAGIFAGSLLLIAFGLDSIIELLSGLVLLWRLTVESRGRSMEDVESAEGKAARVVGGLLVVLSVYVLGTAVYGLVKANEPDASLPGIGVAFAAVIIMPALAVTKRSLARELNSGALSGDAASSITCAYMAATVLAGLVLNAAFGFWWAEDIASLFFLIWLIQEIHEAFEGAGEEAGAGDD